MDWITTGIWTLVAINAVRLVLAISSNMIIRGQEKDRVAAVKKIWGLK